MTFDQAVAKRKQIEPYTLGLPLKGKQITSLFIGPTDWDCISDYLNAQNQKGHEITQIEFASENFSVYGVSVDDSGSYPNYSLVLLDDFDKMMG